LVDEVGAVKSGSSPVVAAWLACSEVTAASTLAATVFQVVFPVARAKARKCAGMKSDGRGVYWLNFPLLFEESTQSPSSGSRLCGPTVDWRAPARTVRASAR
jgi:hypothetical protein